MEQSVCGGNIPLDVMAPVMVLFILLIALIAARR